MHAASAAHRTGRRHDRHGFLRHLLEMGLAMMAGMLVSATIFLSAVGMTAAEAMREHAVLFVVLQAVGMTVTMVAWMRHRRHSWRSSSEMATAMVLPAVPLICLRLLDVISGPICRLYCLATIVAMVILMLYRRSDYGATATTALAEGVGADGPRALIPPFQRPSSNTRLDTTQSR
jgi:hypothetical protein